jgi:hypothetical protein
VIQVILATADFVVLRVIREIRETADLVEMTGTPVPREILEAADPLG